MADIDPIPMILTCPSCSARHIDEGEFATKPHHTHACQNCGMVWRPALVPTVGVRFLPGFKNEPAPNPDPTLQQLADRKLGEQIAATYQLADRQIGEQIAATYIPQTLGDRQAKDHPGFAGFVAAVVKRGINVSDLNKAWNDYKAGYEGRPIPLPFVKDPHPHAFVPLKHKTPDTGPADETCEVCGCDPRNSIHEVKR